MKLIVAAVVACAAAFSAGAAENASYVWWEGENSVQTNFPEKTWFSASTFEQSRHEILSGGDWLTNDGARTGAEAFARYEITVPAAGQYSLWARKFWKHGPFRWRFGRGEWQVCGSEIRHRRNPPVSSPELPGVDVAGSPYLLLGAHEPLAIREIFVKFVKNEACTQQRIVL